jgi:hypothetical protein
MSLGHPRVDGKTPGAFDKSPIGGFEGHYGSIREGEDNRFQSTDHCQCSRYPVASIMRLLHQRKRESPHRDTWLCDATAMGPSNEKYRRMLMERQKILS